MLVGFSLGLPNGDHGGSLRGRTKKKKRKGWTREGRKKTKVHKNKSDGRNENGRGEKEEGNLRRAK